MSTRRTPGESARQGPDKADAPARPEDSLALDAYELLRAVSLFPDDEPSLLLQRALKPGRGRRRLYDAFGILEMVEARRHVAAAHGRRLRRGAALAELLAEQLERGSPPNHQRLQEYRASFERQGYSPSGALRAALKRLYGAHFQTLERLLSYALNGRSTVRHRRR